MIIKMKEKIELKLFNAFNLGSPYLSFVIRHLTGKHSMNEKMHVAYILSTLIRIEVKFP